MKHVTLMIWCLTTLWMVDAAAQSKKFTFVEHFSNTHCPICQNNRTKIENDLDKYAGEINTMTIHRKYPYQACPLYQYAKEDADNREAVYAASTSSIVGTPLLCVNGEVGSHNRLTINIDQALKDDDVLVGLNMKESGISSKKVTLDVFNRTQSSMENLFVYAALVEKVVNIHTDGSDWTIHHVFRKFLGSQKGKGDAVGSLAAGDSKTIVLEGQVPNDLEPSDLYVLAWVEERRPDGDSYEIITHNSVSATTSTITSTSLEIPESELSIFPNPVTHNLHVRNTSDFTPQHYRIFSATGQEIKRMKAYGASIDVTDLPAGQYLLTLENDDARVSRKFVKQ